MFIVDALHLIFVLLGRFALLKSLLLRFHSGSNNLCRYFWGRARIVFSKGSFHCVADWRLIERVPRTVCAAYRGKKRWLGRGTLYRTPSQGAQSYGVDNKCGSERRGVGGRG